MPKMKNLVGQVFGKLTVIERVPPPEHVKNKHAVYFLCKCECSKECIIPSGNLVSGNSTNCGCVFRPDLTGQKFEELTVLSKSDKPKHRKSDTGYWKCQCNCGKIIIIATGDIKNTKSCGCLQRFTSNEEIIYYKLKKIYSKGYKDGDITLDEFIKLSQKNCFYCGKPPQNKIKPKSDDGLLVKNYGNVLYNGLDRIIQTLPHNKNNVVTCCGKCNWLKGSKSTQDFVTYISNIYKHRTQTKNTFNVNQFFTPCPVLDKGQIELIDGTCENPGLKIVNSARVSFNKYSSELTEKDIKLIKYLFEHEHFSTFRHSYYSFRIKAPLMVFRQWWKYQIGSDWVENENVGTIQLPETNWNEASGRYVEFKPEFYIPQEIRIQSKNNKQGSEGKLLNLTNGEDPVTYFEESCNLLYDRYLYMVKSGAAKEQARCLLPQNIYSECVWTASLQCILYVLHQRLKSDAQFEIREYAKALYQIMKPLLEPLSLGFDVE